MTWIKKGLIFKPSGKNEYFKSQASIPVVNQVDNNVMRIYFSSRDNSNRSLPTFIEVEADNPKNILYVHNEPILPLGKLGTFDDNGIMPSWIVNVNNKKYLYYIGWNPQVTVSYRLSIGLAISEDGGLNFQKYSEGPICDRSIEEPFFNTAPCVIKEDRIWKMWYVSCTSWKIISRRPEPRYHIKYAESEDGIHWGKKGIVCIDFSYAEEAIGRPCVYLENNLYKMIYCYRSLKDYRTNSKRSYKFGYAESKDGLTWQKFHNKLGFEISKSGWDSEMVEYCYVLDYKNLKYLFYNGNKFGKTGFGYAILDKS